MVKLTGELEGYRAEKAAGIEPDPVMMAPLKLPSIDSELATANKICGCAGMVMVSGNCDTGVGAGTAALDTGMGDTTAIATPAAAKSEAARFRRTRDMEFFMVCILKAITNDRLLAIRHWGCRRRRSLAP